MYTPSMFSFENEKDKIAFIKKYPFATIVTNKNAVPIATQLPFVIKECSGKLILSGHFSKSNEQVKYIENNTSLIVFTEPHAYIAPVHYDKFESVPTWDYIAIHAYGKARILVDEAETAAAMEEMINFYDKAYQKQWELLSDKFKNGMLKGIVAFEIEVAELQGQQKLSQNKSNGEIERIVAHLKKSDIGAEREIAQYIEKSRR